MIARSMKQYDLHQNVAELLQQRGETLSAVCRRHGENPRNFAPMVRPTGNPTLASLERLAEMLETTAEELLASPRFRSLSAHWTTSGELQIAVAEGGKFEPLR